MHIDPIIIKLVGAITGILLLGLILRALKQPYVIVYLIAGVALGPYAFGIVDDAATIRLMSEIGLDLLLFFIGMEVLPRDLLRNWRVALIGTLLQILLSVAIAFGIGYYLQWPLQRSLLIGFVISLSSTAILLRLLKDWNELESRVGQSVLSVLLTQDIAIIPMIIIISSFSKKASAEPISLIKQIIGMVLMASIFLWLVLKKNPRLPLATKLRSDHELQVFSALLLCFGLALLSGFFGLSTGLGAFIGGMIVASTKETDWVHHSLEPFRIVFVAFFFVSIGMMINPTFLKANIGLVVSLLAIVLIVNLVINTIMLRTMKASWKESVYFGVLMCQVGEFAFLLAALGLESEIINNFAYQIVVSIIALSLLMSPVFIIAAKKAIQK